MNRFVISTNRMIDSFGADVMFKHVTIGSFDYDTGSVSSSEVSLTAKAYKRHIDASQYNYPNLVGKDIAEFYAKASVFSSKPSVNDKIVSGTDTYTVQRVSEHGAYGQVILYRFLCVKT
jgi:hypothetical protein